MSAARDVRPAGEPAAERAVDEPGTTAGVVDARGLRCPAPVIRLARAAKETAEGDVLTVWWTDPAARHDIPAWARMRGHEVLDTGALETSGAEPAYATRVRLGPTGC